MMTFRLARDRDNRLIWRIHSIPRLSFSDDKYTTDQYLIDDTTNDVVSAFASTALSSDDTVFIRDLPFAQHLAVAPGHEVLVVHANLCDLELYITPDSPDVRLRPWFEGVSAKVVAFGHSRMPFVRRIDGRTPVDVASVGIATRWGPTCNLRDCYAGTQHVAYPTPLPCLRHRGSCT